MKALIFLDLSNNQISKLDLTQLPTQLQFLKLVGNPYADDDNYWKNVVLYLNLLEELDSVAVTPAEWLFYEGKIKIPI